MVNILISFLRDSLGSFLSLQLAERLTTTILLLCAYAVCATVTEVGQAWVAQKLDDDTAAESGWLNLNPFAHIDIIGVLLVVFVNFAWVRMIPVNPYTIERQSTLRKCLIYFSQAGIAMIFALSLLALLLFWTGPASIYLALAMFGTEFVPLKNILNMFPEKSTLTILLSLFMISLVVYSIFIATISLIANGFRFFYDHYWNKDSSQQYPDHVVWLMVLVVIIFVAQPLRNFLLFLTINGTLLIGKLFGVV